MSHEMWVIITAVMVAIATSSIGVFLVLRRQAMLGDAISHSVLLGIVLAYLLTASRSPAVVLAGAAFVGLFTAFLTSAVNRLGQLQEEASIGIVFTWLFALAVILISAFAGNVDIDQECVLYGEIAFVPFDTLQWGEREIGPRAFWLLTIASLLNLLFIAVGYRQLKTLTFSSQLATSLGIQVGLWHYLMMALVSMTTVAAFDAVGAILVVALLVVPANAAFLLARSLSGMIAISVALGIAAAISGYYLAAWLDASISAAIALMTGVELVLAIVVSRLRISHPEAAAKQGTASA